MSEKKKYTPLQRLILNALPETGVYSATELAHLIDRSAKDVRVALAPLVQSGTLVCTMRRGRKAYSWKA